MKVLLHKGGIMSKLDSIDFLGVFYSNSPRIERTLEDLHLKIPARMFDAIMQLDWMFHDNRWKMGSDEGSSSSALTPRVCLFDGLITRSRAKTLQEDTSLTMTSLLIKEEEEEEAIMKTRLWVQTMGRVCDEAGIVTNCTPFRFQF